MKTLKIPRALIDAAAGLAIAIAAVPVSAVTVYTLDTSDPAASLGSAPYGTVTLTQNLANVDFSVTLAPGFDFVTTGGPHDIFAFNGNGVALGDITNIVVAGGATVTAHVPGADQPFGAFGFGLDCSLCKNGAPGKQADPLTFTVVNAVEADFAVLSTGGDLHAFFAADVINAAGATGAAGAVGIPSAIPEPETYALMLAGLGAMGFVARRRKAA